MVQVLERDSCGKCPLNWKPIFNLGGGQVGVSRGQGLGVGVEAWAWSRPVGTGMSAPQRAGERWLRRPEPKSSNCSLRAESGQPPVFVNSVIEHSHAHLLT